MGGWVGPGCITLNLEQLKVYASKMGCQYGQLGERGAGDPGCINMVRDSNARRKACWC